MQGCGFRGSNDPLDERGFQAHTIRPNFEDWLLKLRGVYSLEWELLRFGWRHLFIYL